MNMKSFFSTALTGFCLLSSVVAEDTPACAECNLHFEPLFAEDLSNAVQRGGEASFQRNEEGHIIGTPEEVGGPNAFLCSEQNYKNFILRFEFRVSPELNSGVQIRSNVLSTNDQGIEFIGGPQVEIDTDTNRNRQWSGGIYGERIGGWLSPARNATQEEKNAFSEQGRRLTNIEEWNEVIVLAVGEHITTWLNGEHRTDLLKSPSLEGFFGFQVHGINHEDLLETSVAWNNILICELEDEATCHEKAKAFIEEHLLANEE